eukprot:Gb_14501 [translate_table: standard]
MAMACSDIGTDWLSPRISFSHDLSQTDRLSPEKRKSDVIYENYSTEFEFCMLRNDNIETRIPVFGETFLSADELFVDGKIMPRIQPVEPNPISIAHHLSLESSRCSSRVPSAAYCPSKPMPMASSGNVSSKGSTKASNTGKELFKLRNETISEESRPILRAGSNSDDAKPGQNVNQRSSPRSLFPFSRSCSTGQETRVNGSFCSSPFSRRNSSEERKSKPCSASSSRSKSVGALCMSKETQTSSASNATSGVPLLHQKAAPTTGSKPFKSSGMLDRTQRLQRPASELWPQCSGQSTPKFPLENASKGKMETPKQKNGGYGSPGRALRMQGSLSSPGRSGNGRSMTKALDSPWPGRQMGGLRKSNSYSFGVRVSPVLNMPLSINPSRGIERRNGNSLFSFSALFPKKDKKKLP